MFEFTIRRLIQGDSNIVGYYQRAVELWQEILEEMPIVSGAILDNTAESEQVANLAETLRSYQLRFEGICSTEAEFERIENNMLGQEIMVITAFFYLAASGGDGEIVMRQRLRDAFRESYCSLEVKGIAREIAEMLMPSEEG